MTLFSRCFFFLVWSPLLVGFGRVWNGLLFIYLFLLLLFCLERRKMAQMGIGGCKSCGNEGAKTPNLRLSIILFKSFNRPFWKLYQLQFQKLIKKEKEKKRNIINYLIYLKDYYYYYSFYLLFHIFIIRMKCVYIYKYILVTLIMIFVHLEHGQCFRNNFF